MKLAETLSHITKKLEEVKESTKQIGEFIEKSQSENKIPQPAIEHTEPHQPIKNNEGVIYDTEIESTLKNMESNTGFFQTHMKTQNMDGCGVDILFKY